MILYLDSDNKIIAFNDSLSPSEENDLVGQNVARYAGEFDFSDIPKREGEKPEFYYLPTEQRIEIRYVAIESSLTETEQAILETAINVDYLVCLQDMNI